MELKEIWDSKWNSFGNYDASIPKLAGLGSYFMEG